MVKYSIPVLAGDGIGPEVTEEGKKVVEAVSEILSFEVDWIPLPYGAEYYLTTGKLISEDDLKDVIQLIQSMNPRPGGQITANQAEYIIPDVTVKKVNNTWKVELNSDAAPKLRINSTYANMIKDVKNSEDNSSMKNHLQEARWFIKSLLSRNETLLKVGEFPEFVINLTVQDSYGAEAYNTTNVIVYSPEIREIINETENITMKCRIYFDGAGGVDLFETNDPVVGGSVGGINIFVNLNFM